MAVVDAPIAPSGTGQSKYSLDGSALKTVVSGSASVAVNQTVGPALDQPVAKSPCAAFRQTEQPDHLLGRQDPGDPTGQNLQSLLVFRVQGQPLSHLGRLTKSLGS